MNHYHFYCDLTKLFEMLLSSNMDVKDRSEQPLQTKRQSVDAAWLEVQIRFLLKVDAGKTVSLKETQSH